MSPSADTFLLFRDRRHGWCAAPPPFRNILCHPIGRGKTQAEAVHDLLGHPEFVHRALLGEWPLNPDIADFLEVAPDRSFFAGTESSSTETRRGSCPRPQLNLGAGSAATSSL
jgi:hypothetical protein